MGNNIIRWKTERKNGYVYLSVEFPFRLDDFYCMELTPQQAIDMGEAVVRLGKLERDDK